MGKIYVTRSFTPPYTEYAALDQSSFERGVFTNQGPLVQAFEAKMRDYLGVPHFHYLQNGTIALQLALDALGIKSGEIITTPFSYVATVSAILWERCTPVFCDITPDTFTLDAQKLEALITPQTRAIMPVNVFGYVCDMAAIEAIAQKHGLKVIYDSAHCFGARYRGKSVLSYGDASTCSFHATKLFQTREGGALILRDQAVSDRVELNKRFGHNHDDYQCLGINAKNCESNAAMGLANFPYIETILSTRRAAVEAYDALLAPRLQRPLMPEHLEYNYAYYPVLFENEAQVLRVMETLAAQEIYPRRYFYPSLNTLPYLEAYQPYPISEDVAARVLCLPLWAEMDLQVVERIARLVLSALPEKAAPAGINSGKRQGKTRIHKSKV